MAVLNWIYRNVYIVKCAAETKEFPFLTHSRTEMDESLGNRTEFRATLDAFYVSFSLLLFNASFMSVQRTVQSSADEKLEQLIAPTVELMMAAMSGNFKTSTDNILEIVVYIKVT